ncbi:uncharacterized protein LY89DRAFT_153956 [Mollisia scopiformis]|uniref:Uncharacterized protein n=1 Tax=Mollisia scopiformis TaxID=149040 RepID=A0A194WYZ7_MOLSC|nr:uncharacterized protein LY89DRAFT_153956 [Mollisia scopiformis]KUJ13188.1 hypothetical protein LY89DRAFT_153956 [Mollisia scopiformis]
MRIERCEILKIKKHQINNQQGSLSCLHPRIENVGIWHMASQDSHHGGGAVVISRMLVVLSYAEYHFQWPAVAASHGSALIDPNINHMRVTRSTSATVSRRTSTFPSTSSRSRPF